MKLFYSTPPRLGSRQQAAGSRQQAAGSRQPSALADPAGADPAGADPAGADPAGAGVEGDLHPRRGRAGECQNFRKNKKVWFSRACRVNLYFSVTFP